MDADTLVDEVKDAKASELDRLSSDRRLLAVTGTDLTTEAVLQAAATSEQAAVETFTSWADDESNGEARDVFEQVARTEREHLERVRTAASQRIHPSDAPGALHEYLRDRETTAARVGAGLIGRPLVSSGTHLQFVSFFVNEADGARADIFRELRRDTEEQLDTGAALLGNVCDSDTDWDRGRQSAERAIDIAYEEYASALTDLGINPKSVC